MVRYMELKIGDKVKFRCKDTTDWIEDCGTITEVADDHAIMAGEIWDHYWIDDDTAYQFYRMEG